MINSVDQLRQVLQGSFLQSRNIIELQVPDMPALALAIQIEHEEAERAWRTLRDLLSATGRWPVLVCDWLGVGPHWADRMQRAGLFERMPFEQEHVPSGRSDHRITSIIEQAQEIDPLAALERVSREQVDEQLDEWAVLALEQTQKRFGRAPAESELRELLAREQIEQLSEVERWLFEWEIGQFGAQALQIDLDDLIYLQWFEPRYQAMALLLLPTTAGWQTTAYMSWYGAELLNSDIVTALLKHWQDRWGAELVAHYGTMLQFITQTRPQDWRAAFELAWEQQTAAESTTVPAGVSLRDHARALLHTDRWFLHERP